MAKLRVIEGTTQIGTNRIAVQLNKPQTLTVYTNQDGFPTAVLRNGNLRQVDQVVERWRLDDEWWRAEPVSRMYFRLLLSGGVDMECYQDLSSGEWFEQRG